MGSSKPAWLLQMSVIFGFASSIETIYQHQIWYSGIRPYVKTSHFHPWSSVIFKVKICLYLIWISKAELAGFLIYQNQFYFTTCKTNQLNPSFLIFFQVFWTKSVFSTSTLPHYPHRLRPVWQYEIGFNEDLRIKVNWRRKLRSV